MTTDKLQVWIKQLDSPDQIERSYRANVQKDGFFELTNVWEGEYTITIPPIYPKQDDGKQVQGRAVFRRPSKPIQFDYRDIINVAKNSTLELGGIEVHYR